MAWLLPAHSGWRWITLLLAVLVVVLPLTGWLGKRPWSKTDDQAGIFYTTAVDIQVLLGVLLWIVERRWTTFFFMNNAPLRFFGLEHPLLMLIALALAHIGRARSRRAESDWFRHRTAFQYYAFSLLLILAGIPWDRLAG